MPERRQRVRIVALKNAVWVVCGLIACFLVFSAWNELRPQNPERERLYERGSEPRAPAASRELPHSGDERPVSDQTFAPGDGANAMTAAPAPEDRPLTAVSPAPSRPRRLTLKEAARRGQKITIVEGAKGVSVEITPPPPGRQE